MKTSFQFFYIIFLFFCSSCETHQELAKKKLIGQWEIREITINGKNCNDDLLINFMTFDEEHFSIPEIYNYAAEDKDNNTKWFINTENGKKISLKLKCKNEIINGSYEVTFLKNYQEKLLGIKLKSKTVNIIAYKFFQNFDLNRNWDTEY